LKLDQKSSRRNVLKTGLASVAAAGLSVPCALAAPGRDFRPKKEGETLVVYLGGDQLHNYIQQVGTMKSVCNNAGWRLLYTYDNYAVTPEVLSQADIFIYTRWEYFVGTWDSQPLMDTTAQKKHPPFDYDGFLDVIMDNVENRGMGFMPLHCTIAHYSNTKFCDFMGVRTMMHGPIQTVHMHNFNQDHPISRGIDDFDLGLDENFGVELTDPTAVPLYESTGLDDKRHDIAGWCVEKGKGRIVGLAAGHTHTAWRHPDYYKLYVRGAHWAMKKDIPADA